MTSLSLLLAVLIGCGGSTDGPPGGADDATPEAPADGPPEGFACPEGATQKGGPADANAELWFVPKLLRPQGDGPIGHPDDGMVDAALVPEPDPTGRVWACVTEDGARTGPYYATVADGEGRIEGAFDGGAPSGDWLGLWFVDEPEEAAPDDAPAEGEAPAEGDAPAEGEAPAEPEKPKPAGEPEVPDGARLMFAGSFGEGGIMVGKWFHGCEPGCNMDYQIRGNFNPEGKMQGRWTFLADQSVAHVFYGNGELQGRYVNTFEDQTTRGAYIKGKRAASWVTKKGEEVVEKKDYGGTVVHGRKRRKKR